MAEVTLFGYFPVQGVLHRVESHFKLLLLPLLAAVVSSAPWPVAAGLFLVLSGYFLFGSVPFKIVLKSSVFLLVLAVFLYGSVFLQPPPWKALILERSIYLLKLAAFLLLGLVFTATTSSGDIRDGIARLLFFLPRKIRINIILLLTFVFALLPLQFRLYHQVRDAVSIRGAGRLKNPLNILIKSLIPFMTAVLLKAKQMADAYTVRCLSDQYHPPKAGRNGFAFFLVMTILCLIILSSRLWLPFLLPAVSSALESFSSLL